MSCGDCSSPSDAIRDRISRSRRIRNASPRQHLSLAPQDLPPLHGPRRSPRSREQPRSCTATTSAPRRSAGTMPPIRSPGQTRSGDDAMLSKSTVSMLRHRGTPPWPRVVSTKSGSPPRARGGASAPSRRVVNMFRDREAGRPHRPRTRARFPDYPGARPLSRNDGIRSPRSIAATEPSTTTGPRDLGWS